MCMRMKTFLPFRTKNKNVEVYFPTLLIVISLIIIVMIFNSNFEMGLIKSDILSGKDKILIFSSYVVVFTITGFILLRYSYRLYHKNISIPLGRISFLSIIVVYVILTITLISTIIQMYFFKTYSNIVFYLISYISFISSLVYLSLLTFKFIQWYKRGKNYLILLFGILFTIYCCNIILSLMYLIDGLATHPSSIQLVSPGQLRTNSFSVNTAFPYEISMIYDALFIISFILAWILTVLILKQYSHRLGKIKFWLLVSLPLLFYLIRSDFFLANFSYSFSTIMPNIDKLPTSILDSISKALINSTIQIGAIFFGFSFLTIILKIKNYHLQKDMMLIVIGMIIIFGSRDLHSIFDSTFPPGGIVTISFMSLGSYVLYSGLILFLKLVSKDQKLYRDLTEKVEADTILLRNIILSEKQKELEKKVKPLVDYAIQWQKENQTREMNIEEAKEIVNDVVSRIRINKKLDRKEFDDKIK